MSTTRTHFPTPMLLCRGLEPHISMMPDVRDTAGATGDVICAECSEPMSIVDVLTVAERASWSGLRFERRVVRRYFS